MKNIKELLNKKLEVKKSRRSEKGDLVDTFLSKLNPPRIKDGYSKLTFGRMAKLLKGKDIYPLFKECEKAKDFSKYFWYKIKK